MKFLHFYPVAAMFLEQSFEPMILFRKYSSELKKQQIISGKIESLLKQKEGQTLNDHKTN